MFTAALLLACTVSMTATKLVYDSIYQRYDAAAPIPQALQSLTHERQAHQYVSGENRLSAWLYRCRGENARDALVIVVPGFHAGADSYLWQIQSLLELGWSVLAFDATGSFSSEGDSTRGFPQILCDLEATLKYVENCKRFGYNDIVVLGHSQGGYAACCALALEYDIDAVVSVSGVNSAMEGVMGLAEQYAGPLAKGNYAFLWTYQALLFGTQRLNLRSDEAISQSRVPVLVIHGASDELIPADEYSIISYSDRIDSITAEFLIWSEAGQDGHTSVLYDADGRANRALMARIHDFLVRSTG